MKLVKTLCNHPIEFQKISEPHLAGAKVCLFCGKYKMSSSGEWLETLTYREQVALELREELFELDNIIKAEQVVKKFKEVNCATINFRHDNQEWSYQIDPKHFSLETKGI